MMNASQLIELGLPNGEPVRLAQLFIRDFIASGGDPSQLTEELGAIIAEPQNFLGDPLREALARVLYAPAYKQRDRLAPWQQWGSGLDANAVAQLANACALPVAVAGALMPDAHPGYGLPIGGVLATEDCVIPYAVGVDIACRMMLTVFDRKANIIPGMKGRLANIIEDETRFGMGAEFKTKRNHDVMDANWSVSPITRRYKDKAWAQLGTSGSGNHFVEFGAFTVTEETEGMRPGEYLALLSHSGSRGTGALVCQHYSRIAMDRRYDLRVENHHNFAWKERHIIDGVERDMIVHRKGATPAGEGVLGIIPGSMATPGFLVRGKGNPASLHSASHGAGRVMSRKQAAQSFTWSTVKKQLAESGVQLLSAGIDEAPGVYKDIHSVMSAQTDLVEVLGRFDPKLVKMAPAGEKAED